MYHNKYRLEISPRSTTTLKYIIVDRGLILKLIKMQNMDICNEVENRIISNIFFQLRTFLYRPNSKQNKNERLYIKKKSKMRFFAQNVCIFSCILTIKKKTFS